MTLLYQPDLHLLGANQLPAGWSAYPPNPTGNTSNPVYGATPVSNWPSTPAPGCPAPPLDPAIDGTNILQINANVAIQRGGLIYYDPTSVGQPALPASDAWQWMSPMGKADCHRGGIFRGTNLGTAAPTYYAFGFIKPFTLRLWAVQNGVGSPTSPPPGGFPGLSMVLASNQPFIGNGSNINFLFTVRVNNGNSGPNIRLTVQRFDTSNLNGYYLVDDGTGAGKWQLSFGYAMNVVDQSANPITGAGMIGFWKEGGTQDVAYFAVPKLFDNTVNATPPSILITTPTNGTGTPTITGPFNVTANYAAATGVNATSAQLLVDSIPVGSPARLNANSGTVTFPYDSRFLLNGTHTLTAQVTDDSLFVRNSQTVSIIGSNDQTLRRWNTPLRPSWAPTVQLCYGGFTETNGTDFDAAAQQILGQISGIMGAANAHTIRKYNFPGPVLLYVNYGNTYLQQLVHWNWWADKHGYDREASFFHQLQSTLGGGTDGGSTVAVRNFWGVYVTRNGVLETGHNLLYGRTDLAREPATAIPNGLTFPPTQNDAVYLGFLERFDTVTFVYQSPPIGAWTAKLQVATSFDVNGVAQGWTDAVILSDTTNGFTQSGAVRFDPVAAKAAGWKAGYPLNNPSTGKPAGYADAVTQEASWMFYPGLWLYYVRVLVTATGTPPRASSGWALDYYNEVSGSPVVPAWDFAADADGDGYLNDSEWPNRARFSSFLHGGLVLSVNQAVYSQSGAAGIATLRYVTNGPNQALSASVVGNTCTVNLATDQNGNSITTDPDLVPVINAAASPALFTAALNSGKGGSANAVAKKTFTVDKLTYTPASLALPVIVKYITAGPGVATTTVSVANNATNSTITVSLATDGSGNSIATAPQIMAAVNSYGPAAALVTVTNPNNATIVEPPMSGTSWAFEPPMTGTNGADARFYYQSRMPGQYGSHRYTVNAAGPRVLDWAVDFSVSQFTVGDPNATPNTSDLDGFFVDNSSETPSTPAIVAPWPTYEAMGRYNHEYGSVLNAVGNAINASPTVPTGRSTRILLQNSGGQKTSATVLRWCPNGFSEFALRSGQHATSAFTGTATLVAADAANSGLNPPPLQLLDTYAFSKAGGPPVIDPNVNYNNYCYYLMLGSSAIGMTINGGEFTSGPWSASEGPLYVGNLKYTLAAGANNVWPGGRVAVTYVKGANGSGISVNVITNVPASNTTNLKQAGVWNVVVTLATDINGNITSTDADVLAAVNGYAPAANLVTPTLVGTSSVRKATTSGGYNWYQALPTNLGTPSGTYALLDPTLGTPGTTPDGNAGFPTCVKSIYRRVFVDANNVLSALILFCPISQDPNPANAGTVGPYPDPTPATITLTSAYYPLLYTGDVGPQTNTVTLGNGQGAILLVSPAGATSGGGPPPPSGVAIGVYGQRWAKAFSPRKRRIKS